MYDYLDPLQRYRRLLGLSLSGETYVERVIRNTDQYLQAMGISPAGAFLNPIAEQMFSTRLAELVRPHPAVAALIKTRAVTEHLAKLDVRWKAAYGHLPAGGAHADIAVSLSRAQRTSLLGGAAALTTLGTAPDLGDVLPILRSSDRLARFAQRTSKAAITAEGVSLHALTLSIDLASMQKSVLDEYYATVASRVLPSGVRTPRSTPNLFRWEQRQLLEDPELTEDEDVEDLVATQRPPVSEVFRLGNRLARLLADIREDESLAGSGFTIPLTTQVYSSTVDLQQLVAEDRATFADFVRSLYMIFYEGASPGGLRYLREHGGSLESVDCQPVWIVKRLRDRWLQHDTEHGSSREREKKAKELRAALSDLGHEGGMPRSATEFIRIQLRLLAMFCDFAKRLRDERGLRSGRGP